MNIDTRTYYGRFVVARYGRGAPTVHETATGRTVVVSEDRLPDDEAGFDALFEAETKAND